MGSSTATNSWDQQIEKLKSRERQIRTESKEDFKASNLMAPELYKAIRRGTEPVFLSVLEKRCELVHVSDIVEQVTRGGNTILHLAILEGRPRILSLMAKHFPQLIIRTNIKGDTALHFAARSKEREVLREVFTTTLNLYAPQIRNDNEERINLLRMKNEFGNTALHEAVMAHNYRVVCILFAADKEVANYLNKEGKSPLYLAVETKQNDIVDLLLEAALSQNRERHQGTSPLHAAIMVLSSGRKIKYKHKSLLGDWVIDDETPLPPTLDYETPPPPTPRVITCNSSAKKMIEQLPGLVFQKDQKGRTALHFAASMGNLEGVRIILTACPQSALEWDLKGNLPIHIACKKGHVNVVKEFLLKQEPWFNPLDLLNQKGQNLLHIAAKSGKETVMRYVLNEDKLEQLLNETDKNGNTPLHLASKYMHPKILHLLTQNKRLNVNLMNNKGMTARDIVVLKRSTPSTLREFLSFAVLKSRGTPLSEKGRRIRHLRAEPPQIKWIKERVSIILLVAILIATITFAAGFTVPGGVNSSEDKDAKKIGMATLVNKKMFQLFTICDAIAMYSSTMGSFILLWAHLGDFHLASSATYFASHLVGLALIAMSVAFMAALHLAVKNVSWLADTVIAIGVIFLLMFLGVFTLLVFPLGERSLFLGPISDFIFKMVIHFSGSYGKLRKIKVKELKAMEGKNKTKEEKGESQQIRTEKLVRQCTF